MSMLLVDCMIINHTKYYIYIIYTLYIYTLYIYVYIYIHYAYIYIYTQHIGDDQNPWAQQRPGESRQICTWTGFFNWWTLSADQRGSVGWWNSWWKKDPMKPATLRWTNILPWKITIFNGKIHYIWQFSIAMLNYQRVQDILPSNMIPGLVYTFT